MINEQKVNILLVDDRVENLIAIQAVLDSPQYRLICANSGEEALRCILKVDVAVILLDVQMPGLNGFETARTIKAREKSKHIPIIFVTAISQAAEHVQQGYAAGAIDYIFKPYQPDTLRMKVEGFAKMYIKNREAENLAALRTKELLTIHRQMDSYLDNFDDGFLALDREWRFLNMNLEAERMLQCSKDEWTGKQAWEVLDISDTQLKDQIQVVYEQNRPTHFELNLADRWYMVHAYPTDNGISMYFNDVTGQKNMEHNLQSSEECFRKVFHASPTMMAIRSLQNGVLIDVNWMWLKNTGYAREELDSLGQSFFRLADNNEQCDRWDSPLQNVQITYMTKNGEEKNGLLSTEVIEIQHEKCVLQVIIDITEKLRFEKEMSRLDQLNLIGEMAAGIAHEIRNPMTTVRGFLQLAKHNEGKPMTGHIDIMVEELNRANAIITEFLTLAKNKSVDRQPMNLNAIVQAIYPLINAEALLAGKNVKLELDPHCPLLEVDGKEIRQLVLNLALNGLEAMQEGGSLRIATVNEEADIRLTVQDEGSGISKEVLAKLGTPFFTTKDQGTGLGLAVCYSVASRHQAVIDIETSPSGTSFHVRFRKAEGAKTVPHMHGQEIE